MLFMLFSTSDLRSPRVIVTLVGFVTCLRVGMLGMTPRIIFERSKIDTSQSGDALWSGRVNLKANINP